MAELEIKTTPILGTTIGEENKYGSMAGRALAGPMIYARVSTEDTMGVTLAYTGEGELTDDPLDSFGHRAVVYNPGLQKLLAYICRSGFEHQVAMTMGSVASILAEAFETYMGWDVYHHVG
ncbi:MAG: hypothetical protein ACXWMV_02005 [Syntrophales bacterium]